MLQYQPSKANAVANALSCRCFEKLDYIAHVNHTFAIKVQSFDTIIDTL